MKRALVIVLICCIAAGLSRTAALLAVRSRAEFSTSVAGLEVRGGKDVTVDRADRVTPLEHVFELHNPTKQVIRVLDVCCGCACMASELETKELQPGGSVPLRVSIRTFDAYRARYRETIRVVTDTEELVLSIAGNLPLPETVMYRPKMLYLNGFGSDENIDNGLGSDENIERTVVIRIPKHRCHELTTDQICWMGEPQLGFRLVEQESSELYRDFILTVTVPKRAAQSVSGTITLDTGSGIAEIQVHTSSRKMQ